MIKKILLTLCFIFCITICTSAQDKKENQNKKIGISMPVENRGSWKFSGEDIKSQLEKYGYTVYLTFAEDDPELQILQIKQMIEDDCSVLIIAPVHGYTLTDVLAIAEKKNIKVISFDRLILNSTAVSYYVTFDNYKTGALMGHYLVRKLNLKNRTEKNPVYMEFFTGDITDFNVPLYFYGAMNVLKLYIEKGVIIFPSGQYSIQSCQTYYWSSKVAEERMISLIDKYNYHPDGQKLDAVCCSNDSTATGVTKALLDAGYTAKNFPLITGQDCFQENIESILNGTQSMSIFKDPEVIDAKTVEMTIALLNETEPKINNKIRYNNEAKDVPSYLCNPNIITKETYKKYINKQLN
jgi:putative multiple sugar transport system substrate-binding protein